MKAKTLMIQGTGSGVGKSIITAALCRRFFHEGWKVAPFKAQNMALNSYVTYEGGEIGRAQAFQAEACGVEPRVHMNPVLLKPCGDNLSQVIIMGKVVGNRTAKDYFNGKEILRQDVHAAFKNLDQEYELIILEGAGSPAEINLKKWDIVNMDMADFADAPVLIVGDIDRGGVFAWMKGTFDLLKEKEQNRVCGFIINKFRGDTDILKTGLDQFEEMVGKPILGVIPYCRDLVVDEEDAIPLFNHPSGQNKENALDVAFIWLPRIANFTDVSPLAYDPAISTRYVAHSAQLGNPDLIVIPGSKNTIDDMDYLKSKGLNEAIRNCHLNGTVVLGICGGYQMMGDIISDPHNQESRKTRIQGMGLFDFETIMEPYKITRQVKRSTLNGPVFPGGLFVEGYEIHMGRTRFHSEYMPLFEIQNEESSQLGVSDLEGRTIGTHLHGFLDNDPLRHALLNHVRRKRNYPETENGFNYGKFREEQLNRLENLVCGSIDMERIKNIINDK